MFRDRVYFLPILIFFSVLKRRILEFFGCLRPSRIARHPGIVFLPS